MSTNTFKATFTEDKNNSGSGILSMEGDLTIRNIKKIHEYVLKSSKNYKQISIDIKNVAHLDLTIIQLITSLRKTYKTDSISCDLPATIKKNIDIAGMTDILKLEQVNY